MYILIWEPQKCQAKAVPCQILLYKQPEEGWDTAQGSYWELAESLNKTRGLETLRCDGIDELDICSPIDKARSRKLSMASVKMISMTSTCWHLYPYGVSSYTTPRLVCGTNSILLTWCESLKIRLQEEDSFCLRCSHLSPSLE